MDKPILTVSATRPLRAEDVKRLADGLAPLRESLGCEVLVLPEGQEIALHSCVSPVVSAIEQNTAAVREMAAACMALVAAMAEAEDVDSSDFGYNLDGSPVAGLDAG